ncbi:uncharacterized protein C16orf52 homolog A-like [Xenia sp. Carnegie-2017]|uniref:uncharacterized protein C16orf52 homolog A-like n=1 Tax=Xenia sp. Carnegie-2017 TaxID=2897299 RepID=UPI001F045666|nr:uncharacterized protein C16orf52 homolog A-like [Xenia sp. Carnegie-2017]
MPRRVYKVAIVGGSMCALADVFAVVSLLTPSWVVNDFLGHATFGLTKLCQKPMHGDKICVTPKLSDSWKATLVFLILGILSLTITCVLIFISLWKPRIFNYGKWVSVVAAMQLLLASIIFPIGFGSPEVGGTPFKLPPNNSLGSSYVFFIVAISLLWAVMCA